MSIRKKTITNTVILCLVLSVGFVMGWIVKSSKNSLEYIQPPTEIRENSPDLHFTNPLLFSRASKEFYTEEFEELNMLLEVFIKKALEVKTSESVSVYFRDLNTGHWTGINEDQKYHPASMFKVLLMMSYLKEAEDDPSILSKKFFYEEKIDNGQFFKPRKILLSGSYTVQQLLQQMIVHSDNQAMKVLDKEDRDHAYHRAYTTFQFPLVDNVTDSEGYISPRLYSALFRTLYNSTYLSDNFSEQALKLLTLTTFTEGLVAGVPRGIPVAHKFGEYGNIDAIKGIKEKELHDCGIIYYPRHPYFLCIMTQGSDFVPLRENIKDISKLVYEYVEKRKK